MIRRKPVLLLSILPLCLALLPTACTAPTEADATVPEAVDKLPSGMELLATLEAESMTVSPSRSGKVVSDSSASGGRALLLNPNASAAGSVALPASTETLVVRARAVLCEGAPRMVVRADGNPLLDVVVTETAWHSHSVALPEVPTSLELSYPSDARTRKCDRSLVVDVLSFAASTPGRVEASSPLALSASSVAPGEVLTGKVTYRNSGGQPVTLTSVRINARHVDAGASVSFSPALEPVTLEPGAETTLTASHSFTETAPAGNWEAFSAWLDEAGVSHESAPGVPFVLSAPSSPDPGTPSPEPLPAFNVRVDFTSPGRPTSNMSLGSCISTYANGGTNLIKGTNQALWKQYLADLGPLVWRIPLFHHSGQVGSSAGGIHGGNEGAAYISAIKSINGIPMIAVGGSTNDNDIQSTDAAALVRYFNDNGGQNGGPVDHFIIGNEPDNGFGLDNYINGGNGSSGFGAITTAMRQATTRRLFLAGPALTAWADYKFADYRAFFSAMHGATDVVDFHKYGDDQQHDNVNRTSQYQDAVKWLRNEIDASFGSRAGEVAIQLGEFNYHPFYASWGDAFYTSRNLVHTASVIGRVLTEGGRAYQYSDNNGPLGLVTDGTAQNGQPSGQHVRLPAYWGLSAWSGGVWTRRYGAVMVQSSTSLPDFEVYATDNAKKIILINKSTSTDREAVVELVGKASGTYSAWRYERGMDPTAFGSGAQFRPPTQVVTAAAFSNGGVKVQVPWMSVTVLTVD